MAEGSDRLLGGVNGLGALRIPEIDQRPPPTSELALSAADSIGSIYDRTELPGVALLSLTRDSSCFQRDICYCVFQEGQRTEQTGSRPAL